MKRILSILMSMAIIVTLLVSMSVSSFAVTFDEQHYVNFKPENGNVEVSVIPMSTEEADAIAMEICGEDFAAFASYYPTDIYLYKFRIDISNLPIYTVKSGMKYYGEWLMGTSAVFQFDINDMAYTDDLGAYVWGKTDACFDSANNFLAAEETAKGTWRIGRVVDMSTTYLKNLPPMNGTLAAINPGAETSNYTIEIYAMTNTDTFDFNIFNLYYSTITFDSAHAKAPANTAPATVLNDGTSVVRDLHGQTYSVVDGVLQTSGGEEEPVTHTFTVYNEDGSVLASADVEEGAAIEMPTAPAVTGKTFSHWSLTEGGAEVEPETVMGTEDLTYYAVYETNKYTITFNVDGATTTQTVEYGETPSYAGTPSKEGYTFTGWDKDFAPATADTTYTAQFAIKTYTITFIVDGATTTKTVNHGETPDYGSTPSKAGYNFTGWTPAIVAATGDATYTAQFDLIPPTKYEITFVVDGVETKVETIEGQTPVYPNGTPAKDGYNFTGWTPAIVAATENATYTAQFELIPVEPTESVLEITTVERIPGDIFPGSSEPTVDVIVKGATETISAARLHRVHTKFDYEAGDNPLVEMGMLFVPKAVADKAGVSTAEEIVAAGIAKDANCSNLPGEITGGTTNVVFKAGLINVPEAYKGITIYAIPYYTLSGGARQYHSVIETTF